MKEYATISGVVQNIVANFLSARNITNYELLTSKATLPGDNFLGVITKLDVIHVGCKILSLIVKSAPQNQVFRKHTSIRKAYIREIYVYTNVLPRFLHFQKERNIQNVFESFVKCHATISDELDETLIMDNMQEEGYIVPDRKTTLDYNHALLVMNEYGRLHALTFAIRDQTPELFKDLSENMEDEHFRFSPTEDEVEALAKGLRETTERGLRGLDPVKDEEAYRRFQTFHERANKMIEEVVSSRAAGEYAVFGHGDSWLNNILFKYKNGFPTQLCFLDWQFARLGSPVLDLSYFLFSCISENTRDKYYDNLICAYYESLSNFLETLGSEPHKLFPFTALEEHLQKFSVYGLYMAMITLYLIVSDPAEIPDMQNSASEEETMAKFQYETKNIEKYYERFCPIVRHFVKYNYKF